MTQTICDLTPGRVLFLLAHQDDEYFLLPRIRAEVLSGSDVSVVYTTDGAGYGVQLDRRLDESKRVLVSWGVEPSQLISLGGDLQVPDGKSHLYGQCLFEGLVALESIRGPWVRVYTPAWEGGHVDHDLAHILAQLLTRRFHAIPIEFSLYRAIGSVGPFFVCGSLLHRNGRILADTPTVEAAVRWWLSALHYRSQWKSFVGLMPLSFVPMVLRRRLECRVVQGYDYTNPPHKGRLFYERRFGISFQEFQASAQGLIKQL